MEEIRLELLRLHKKMVEHGLVVWTGGNISQRVDSEHFLIKPSGVDYSELSQEDFVLCDLEGEVVQGTRSPSSDTFAHAYIYKHMSHVAGVVHTHSNYACGFAAVGQPIPCVLTAIADEFGGEIPLGPFAIIGDDSIGRGVVETLRDHTSKSVLMKNHGVFAVGDNAEDALKAAVMTEDNAKSVFIARQLGEPIPIPEQITAQLFQRYQNKYGQSPR